VFEVLLIIFKELNQNRLLDRRAFEFEFPNNCWQSDISVGPYITVIHLYPAMWNVTTINIIHQLKRNL